MWRGNMTSRSHFWLANQTKPKHVNFLLLQVDPLVSHTAAQCELTGFVTALIPSIQTIPAILNLLN